MISARRPDVVVDARMIASSGLGRYIRSALKALASEGARIVALGDPSRIREACDGLGIEALAFGVPTYDPREQFALAAAVPRCGLFFSPHVTTTAFPVRARRRVTTVHDDFHLSDVSGFGTAKRAYARFIYGTALRVSDLVLAVSDCTKSRLARRFPFASGKIRALPNGVDLDFFHRVQEKPRSIDGDFILFVGNMKPHKNMETALRAARSSGSLPLAAVGAEAGFRHGLGDRLESLRSDPRLALLGAVDDEELRRLYSRAACLVFPSLREGFGYPMIEAMACGCPVVCSDIPELRETAGDAALYRDPRSPESFAEGIRTAAAPGRGREELIARGRVRATLFSETAFARGLVAELAGMA
jgi:glycosyltransferase involved in cell wall biosynthesis